MHEKHDIEKRLKFEISRISEEIGGAPVLIVIGEDTEANIPTTMTASSIKDKDVRLRDLLGVFQTSIQIESWKHFGTWK